jgi:hypothetical protein
MARDMAKARRYQKARYEQWKANRQCVKCGAGLQDDDGVMCVECVEQAFNTKRRSWARVRRYKKLYMRRYRREHAEHNREYHRKLRRRKLEQGQCTDCREPRLPGKRFCAVHLAKNQEYERQAYLRRSRDPEKRRLARRKRKGGGKPVIPIMDARKLRSKRIDVVADGPADAVLCKRRYRLLAQLRFLEWPQTAELFEAMGLPTEAVDAVQYGVWIHILGREVKAGRVEYRQLKKGSFREYRITEAGLAYVRDVQAQARRAA